MGKEVHKHISKRSIHEGAIWPTARYYARNMSETIPPATKFVESDGPFKFHFGGELPSVRVAYETWGELSPARDNAVMILTGLSPNAHAASNAEDPSDGWWEPMIGPGKAIDTDRYFLICINSLGSCKGSTGPASLNPDTGKPWRLDFPKLAIQDIAAGAQMVLDHFGIERLHMLVGPSLGGMTGIAWLQQNPKGAKHFLSISGAPMAEPFATAIRSLQRECIVNDPAWQDGQYSDEHWPELGMRQARKLGMISYRSAEEWLIRFGRNRQKRYPTRRFGMDFDVESYLENVAIKFIGGFDPCCYLYLSHSMELYDASDGHPDLASALAPFELESVLVIGVPTDILWPLRQQKLTVDAFRAAGINCQLQVLDSIQGHDSFLVDYDRFSPAVEAYFKSTGNDK